MFVFDYRSLINSSSVIPACQIIDFNIPTGISGWSGTITTSVLSGVFFLILIWLSF